MGRSTRLASALTLASVRQTVDCFGEDIRSAGEIEAYETGALWAKGGASVHRNARVFEGVDTGIISPAESTK